MNATSHKVVFLDRRAIRADIRPLRFAHEWIEHATTQPEETVARLSGATIAIVNRVRLGETELARLPQLQMIAVAATGYDHVDLAACRSRGVTVTNVRDWCVTSLPEHTFAMMLALRRQLLSYRAALGEGRWQASPGYGFLLEPLPHDLCGSTLGVIGGGALGSRIAALGAAFGMRTMLAERRGATEIRPGRTAFETILRESDVLSVNCPLTEETRGLIGAAELSRMKRNALLIDCSRGGVVDNGALARALAEGRIAGAGVDVLEQEPPRAGNPLLDLRLPNLLVTPHMAWASQQAIQMLADQLMDTIEAFAAGHPRNVVSAPQT